MSTRFVGLLTLLLCLAGQVYGFDPLNTSNQCDYVVLAHDSLVTQAQRLVTHRSGTLGSCLVTTTEVTSSFAGASDLEKIRSFVLYAYENWKIAPTYLLLAGDANIQAAVPENIDVAANNLIPTKVEINPFDSWAGSYNFANDGWYVTSPIADEKKPIMHLGRVPARNNTELGNAVTKFITYDSITGTPAWLSKTMMLVGDANVNAINEEYKTMNDQLYEQEFSLRVPAPAVLYSSNYSLEGDLFLDSTNDTRTYWNSGYGLVNALGNTIGHDVLVLMAEFFTYHVTTTFTQTLSPTNYLPVVFAATCLANYFAQGTYPWPYNDRSIGEDLLMSTSASGAIAVIGATHVNDMVETYDINRRFSHMLFSEGVKNVGRLFSAAKGLFLESGIGHDYLGWEHTLLGDPATNLKIHPLPTPTAFIEGAEIEEAPVAQNKVIAKSAGISWDNLRIVHEENGIIPVSGDRMIKVTATDASGTVDYIEWTIQSNINVPITQNMHLSFWLNIPESPSGSDKICIDGDTSSGRIKDNISITDQNGTMLDAKYRAPIQPGWQLFYADLSPLRNTTLRDIRVRYEDTNTADSGNLVAYIDDIRVEQFDLGQSEEILNYSFEDDKDINGTPDFWTNLHGETTTVNALRSTESFTTGSYGMKVVDQWDNNEGAQQIVHTNPEIGNYYIRFSHSAPDPTTFTLKIINVETSETLVNLQIPTDVSWQTRSFTLSNPAYNLWPGRIKVQFIPNDSMAPVYIDEMHIQQDIPTGVAGNTPRNESLKLAASPNPFNPRTKITYVLSKGGPVKIYVYSVRGELVKKLVDGTREAGTYSVQWNGTGENGESMPSGTYMLRIVSGKESSAYKISLIK